MNNINIKIAGANDKIRPNVFIDGKEVKYTKNNYGDLELNYATEKDSIEISICKYLEISGKLWFLMSLFFFVISLFGIFDAQYDKKCIVIDCKYKIKLKEQTNIKFTLCNIENTGRAVVWEGDCECEQIKNEGYIDKKAKKRLKIMLAVKILMWIALIVGIILALAL